MRSRAWLGALGCLFGCSFIDDFDRFRAADVGAGDGGQTMDAQVDPPLDAGGGELDAQEPPIEAGDTPATDAADAAMPPVDCAVAVEGTRCGDGFICRYKVCLASTCGDGLIDSESGEECDDTNEVRGDGCEPTTCTFSCELDAECDDTQLCNGQESCELTAHRCVAGDPATVEAASCTTAASVSGACHAGLCVPAECGDGELDPGEVCEPAQPGCRLDCQPGCMVDADCHNDDACDGEETCDPTTRECRAGTPLDCIDSDACTVDGLCDPSSGCLFQLVDADRDNYSPGECAATSGRDPDCNDENASVWPGAGERCDLIDNDCDGQIDEGVLLRCFADRDGDGFPVRDEVQVACSCPAGSMAVQNPDTYLAWDCWDEPLDAGANVYPGQTMSFDQGYGPGARTERSFDYDCDGIATPFHTAIDGQGCSGLLGLVCETKRGYQQTPPPCGELGSYVTCTTGALACEPRTSMVRQACR